MAVKCWVVEHGLAAAGSCSGRIVAAHLIPKQRIKRQFPRGAQMTWRETSKGHAVWEPVPRGGADDDMHVLALEDVVWDRRVVVPICGGPMGNAGHHGQLDAAGVNRLQIPRALLPAELEEFAEEYGLEWSLEADYGPKEKG